MTSSKTNLVTTLEQPIKFLGCTVLSFTSQLGWGLDSSSISIELVEDCENGDLFLGKTQEIVGGAAYFTLMPHSPFTFGGIIQNWEVKQSSAGVIFSVKMSDAKEFLGNVNIVTDSFSLPPNYANNYYNVYAKYESSVHFGNCTAFGTADSTELGMNYNNIIKALLAIGGQDQGDPYQRFLMFSPAADLLTIPGTGRFKINLGLAYEPSSDSLINTRGVLNDGIPIGPITHRITSSITLLDLINNICELMGRNFYVSMAQDPDGTNIVNVHCVHLIDTFAGDYGTLLNHYNGVSTDLSYGKELANVSNRNLIFGEDIHYHTYAFSSYPYFGDYETGNFAGYPIYPRLDSQNRYIDPVGQLSDCGFWIYVDITKLNINLWNPIRDTQNFVPVWDNFNQQYVWGQNQAIQNFVWISEADLWAAAMGDKIFQTRIFADDPGVLMLGSLTAFLQSMYPEVKNNTPQLFQALEDLWNDWVNVQGLQISDELYGKLAQAVIGYMNNFFKDRVRQNQFKHDIELVHSFLNNLYQTYYGKQYIVITNERICANYSNPELESGEIKFSSEPNNEGGWVDYGNSILGLSDPVLGFFRGDNGKVGCLVRYSPTGDNGSPQPQPQIPNYNGALDITQLEPDSYITNGTDIWLKAEVKDKTYFLTDSFGNTAPAYHIVLSSPAYLKQRYYRAAVLDQLLALINLFNLNFPAIPQPLPNYRVVRVVLSARGTGYQNGDIVVFKNDSEISDAYGYIVTGAPYTDDNGNTISGWVSSIYIRDGGDYFDPETFDLNDITINSANGNGLKIEYVQFGVHQEDTYCALPQLLNVEPEEPVVASGGINLDSQNVAMTDLNNLLGASNNVFRDATPNAIAIPMKSNIIKYGPYYSLNFNNSYGKINIEVDPDLAPWNYGSTFLMSQAGISKAQTAFDNNEVPLVISENGSASIVGLPMYSLADKLIIDGVAVGPHINSINVTFGGQGITTSYDFKTFARKFGGLSNIVNDQIKNIAKNRQAQLQFIRNQQKTALRITRKAIASKSSLGRSLTLNYQAYVPERHRNISHRALIGEMVYDWAGLPISGTRTEQSTTEQNIVVSEGLDKIPIEIERGYNRKAMISLDGLFSPVSISGDAGLPRFAIPTSSSDTGLVINNKFLNPLSNPGSWHYHSGPAVGHNIDIVAGGSGIPDGGQILRSFYNPANPQKYNEDYRFLGLRGPLVLHSWGYDTDGMPIPNENDTIENARSGVFTEDVAPRFLQDWLQKPSTWPVAPIDLRFDRARGVWVGGGGGSSIRIGKFCNQWPSLSNVKDPANAVKKVVLYEPDTSGCQNNPCPWNLKPVMIRESGIDVPSVVEVINLFSNVAAAEYQTKWCAVTQDGNNYYLLAAEC